MALQAGMKSGCADDGLKIDMLMDTQINEQIIGMSGKEV